MLVLPHTPPLPRDEPKLPNRDAVVAAAAQGTANYSHCLKYLTALEHYLDQVWTLEASATLTKSPWIDRAQVLVREEVKSLSDTLRRGLLKLSITPSEEGDETQEIKGITWTATNEKTAVLAAIGLTYIKLGSLLAYELIAAHHCGDKWKQVVDIFKQALARARYGTATWEEPVFAVIERAADLSCQFAVVAKNNVQRREEPSQCLPTTIPVMTRVVVYVVGELEALAQQLRGLEYVEAMGRYARAYLALYLALGHNEELGRAIGTLQYGQICLQGREFESQGDDPQLKPLRFASKLKGRFSERKNTQVLKKNRAEPSKKLVASLQPVPPPDLAELLDQLQLQELSYTRENNTLAFDTVVDWREIEATKWPLGKPIPLLAVPRYTGPRPGQALAPVDQEYSGKGSYY